MLFLTTKSAENIFYSGHTTSLHKDGTIAVGTESRGWACKWGILKPEFYRIASITLGFDQYPLYLSPTDKAVLTEAITTIIKYKLPVFLSDKNVMLSSQLDRISALLLTARDRLIARLQQVVQ